MNKTQRENDLIRFKVFDNIKAWNKDLIPLYEELEATTFKGHRDAYFKVCELLGSSAFSYLTLFINGEESSYWKLNIK